MLFRIITLLISGTFFLSAYATDISIREEIECNDEQIQKVSEQLSMEESKSDKNSREIKQLTEKKNKLLENKLKKLVDMKNILQKNLDKLIINIKKKSEKEEHKEKHLKEQERCESEIKKLNIDIEACKEEIKKMIDQKEKNKIENDKKNLTPTPGKKAKK